MLITITWYITINLFLQEHQLLFGTDHQLRQSQQTTPRRDDSTHKILNISKNGDLTSKWDI